MNRTRRSTSVARGRGGRDTIPAERLTQRSIHRGAMAAPKRAKPANKRLTQAERVALSDSRMLEAAVQLIDERGTSNTTLKDVGQIAGYSRGLASSRFGSKDALFFELLDRFNRRWKEDSAAAVGLQTKLDAFRSANKGLITFFKNEAKFIRVMYLIAYETVGSSKLMRKQLAEQHEAYRHGVARWIRDAAATGEVRKSISPERIAVQYVAAVFGIIYQWLVNPDAIDCGQALDDLRENTLHVVKA
jgi:AcrR family transcriptional regulator